MNGEKERKVALMNKFGEPPKNTLQDWENYLQLIVKGHEDDKKSLLDVIRKVKEKAGKGNEG